jgi:single-strand DNA-binding protein
MAFSGTRNKIQLIGHLGKDVELKTLKSGLPIAKFSVATSDYYRNSKGEKITNTQWHNIVVFGKLAELVHRLLKKGSKVLIQGKLVYNRYEDRNGITRNFASIILSEFEILSPKK